MMIQRKSWKASLALMLTLGMGVAPTVPLFLTQPASAQLFRSNRTFRIVRGTYIPTVYDDGETTKIVVTPEETLELALTTSQAVRSTRGTEIIPAGSTIKGQIEPYQDGVRFIARELELEDGTRETIQASTEVISRREKVGKGGNDDAIWQGALVGGAAATVISAAVTDVGIFKTLAGAGAGALAGWLFTRNKNSDEVIVIDPQRDLTLIVDEEFLLSRRIATRLSR